MLIEDLKVVIKVAEFRSITAAANHLDMRVATASAALKRVEASLGTELFTRTTRQLRLSNAGERYIPQCEQALHTLEQARQNIKNDLDVIEGEIRLSVSSDLGRNLVTPWLDEFLDDYPDVSVRFNISDSTVDFFRDSSDIALRYGSPKDASLYGFKICNVPTLLCASPEYLAKYGEPSHPQDLNSHNGLFYQLHDLTHNVWEFCREDQIFKVKVTGNRASNDGDLVRRWCVAGQGIAIKSCLDMAADLLSGRVVGAMPEYTPATNELWLICASQQVITPAVRLLRDRLRDRSAAILQQLMDRGFIQQ